MGGVGELQARQLLGEGVPRICLEWRRVAICEICDVFQEMVF